MELAGKINEVTRQMLRRSLKGNKMRMIKTF
jgi:hypothetical protein